MPTAKPCTGQFSEETIALLSANTGREQWLPHPCALCGQQIGARIEKGKWLPEQHWPSVQYKARTSKAARPSKRSKSTLVSPS